MSLYGNGVPVIHLKVWASWPLLLLFSTLLDALMIPSLDEPSAASDLSPLDMGAVTWNYVSDS